jgi:hypothetical protein
MAYSEHKRRQIADAVRRKRVADGLGKEEAASRAKISSITWKRVEDGEKVRDVSLGKMISSMGFASIDELVASNPGRTPFKAERLAADIRDNPLTEFPEARVVSHAAVVELLRAADELAAATQRLNNALAAVGSEHFGGATNFIKSVRLLRSRSVNDPQPGPDGLERAFGPDEIEDGDHGNKETG